MGGSKLVTDAPALEVRQNRGGDIIALDYVDGATFKVLIDDTGRRPLPPAPAYEQVIHGRPWVLATEGRVDSEYRDKPLFDQQIIYMPRNPRGAHGYGFPPVEQILITINTALRRETMQLAHFTNSNVPAGMATSPEGWSPDQVKQYQDWFDNLLSGNLGERTKVIWGRPAPNTRPSKSRRSRMISTSGSPALFRLRSRCRRPGRSGR